jgi:5-methyltetrahydrofolate--homocysteine methyltransferase
MASFLETLRSGRVLLMDGAMGTELQRAGLHKGARGELWNLQQPERVRAIHQDYMAAGAECLLTNTFLALAQMLTGRPRDAEQTSAILDVGLQLARSACGPHGFVLADIGPVLEGFGCADLLANKPLVRVVRSMRRADALLLETYSSPGVIEAVRFLHEVAAEADTPILLSMTFLRTSTGEPRTFSGHWPESFASIPHIAALGVNCGRDIGMDKVIEIIRRYRKVTDLPLFARPNAGTPTRVRNQWVYPHTPQDMAARLPELLEAGVAMVGGCCGTTPEHIAAFRPIIDNWNTRRLKNCT